MVRFSQSLNDGQSQKDEKRYEDDYRFYSQPEQPQRPVYQQRPVYREDNLYEQSQDEKISDILYDKPKIERESVQPDYSKPELDFPKDQNIQFGVEYSPNSRPPVIGNNYTIRNRT